VAWPGTRSATCDLRHHGGDHQAVYAYAREDLDMWEAELGRPLPGVVFGENLTTTGVELTGAAIGERWRVGRELCGVRIPRRTFAGWLGEVGWVRRFTDAATRRRGVTGLRARPGRRRRGWAGSGR
jgi:MOSC domain-containing protein YiiM